MFELLGSTFHPATPNQPAVLAQFQVVMGFFWQGWFLWAFLVFIFGVRHPAPLNDLSPMGLRRTLVGIGVLVLFVLTFTPIPFSQIS